MSFKCAFAWNYAVLLIPLMLLSGHWIQREPELTDKAVTAWVCKRLLKFMELHLQLLCGGFCCEVAGRARVTPRWTNAFRSQDIPKTKESYCHCSYKKKSGGGSTKKSKLYTLKLKDSDDVTQEWDLMSKFDKKK